MFGFMSERENARKEGGARSPSRSAFSHGHLSLNRYPLYPLLMLDALKLKKDRNLLHFRDPWNPTNPFPFCDSDRDSQPATPGLR